MALIFNTNPTTTIYAGQVWSYQASACETNAALGGVSAAHHFTVSAVRGPVAFPGTFNYASAANATFSIFRTVKVDDVQISAAGNESFDLTLTVFSTSGTYVNQDISVSASFSPSYLKRTNIGTGDRNNGADISDFFMRGLGTKG